ncbi:MAG TPA: hypothetical protein VLM05_13645, partial [Mycobacteriales bacterium]|nr:hypothetical protein [Mycobacteriales bacterium]
VKQPATPGPDCVLAAGAGARLHCFAGFRAAIAYATGGRIPDAPATAAAAAGDKAFAAKVTAANTAAGNTAADTAAATTTGTAVTAAATALLGVEYADANLRGSSLTLTGAGAGCDNSGDVDYRFASMPSGWNDRITSFTSFSNCVQQLFRNTNFGGGALTLPIRTLSNVGSAANDQASSLTFN